MEEDERVINLKQYEKPMDYECPYPVNVNAITIEDCVDLNRFKSLGVLLNDGYVSGFAGGLV